MRAAGERDVDQLSGHHVEKRSQSSRTTGLWAVSNVAKIAISLLVHDRKADHFTFAELRAAARDAIGEAS
jgi:hypothetical protein